MMTCEGTLDTFVFIDLGYRGWRRRPQLTSIQSNREDILYSDNIKSFNLEVKVLHCLTSVLTHCAVFRTINYLRLVCPNL